MRRWHRWLAVGIPSSERDLVLRELDELHETRVTRVGALGADRELRSLRPGSWSPSLELGRVTDKVLRGSHVPVVDFRPTA